MRVIIFFLGFIAGLIFLMPKDNLYYTAQKFLAKQHIYINSDISNRVSLNLRNGTIYQNGIDFAKFNEVKIFPFIFYNSIDIKNVNINFQNLKIFNAKITYSIINPLKVYIKATANFGKIEGEIDLVKKFIKIYVLNLTNSNLKSFLRKDKKGYFYYEKF